MKSEKFALRGEAEAVFHFDVIHVERNAEQARSESFRSDTEHAVERMGLHWHAVVLDFNNPGSTRQKMHEEALGFDGVICVVGVHAFIVVREYGVVDGEF